MNSKDLALLIELNQMAQKYDFFKWNTDLSKLQKDLSNKSQWTFRILCETIYFMMNREFLFNIDNPIGEALYEKAGEFYSSQVPVVNFYGKEYEKNEKLYGATK